MPAYTPPVDDILYLLRRVIDTDSLLRLPAFAHVDADTLEDVVRAAGAITAEVIAPINEACDRVGAQYANGRVTLPPGFVDAFHTFRDQGWPSLVLPEAYGGQAMPEVVQGALSEMLNGASVAFTMMPTTGRAASRVLEAHATDELRDFYLPKLVSGEWATTISMTEPQAGSDIGLARTKAVPRGDGSYAISGTKIFISFADHDAAEQIVNIVLARTEGAPAGVRGLSLFLVPKFL
ncbi:MAG: acyl-CoA dehydrogenase family protein, partial [Bauldia litoralis]